jgi:hypothetical protein
LLANLSANETNGACVFPIKATAREEDKPNGNGRPTTSIAVACDVSFQETAKLICTAEIGRLAAIRS